MFYVLKIIGLCLLGIAILHVVHAQQLHHGFTSGGGNITSGAGSVSFSMGQMFYIKAEGPIDSSSEGLQQPFEVSELNTFISATEFNLPILVYPNPTNGMLAIKIGSNQLLAKGDIQCYLFSINGKVLNVKSIADSETEMDMRNYTSGAYFLKIVWYANKSVHGSSIDFINEAGLPGFEKTFKIIKK